MMNILKLRSTLILSVFLFSADARVWAEERVGAADVAFANGMDTTLVEAVAHLKFLITDLHREGSRWEDGRRAILLYHVGSFAKNLQEVKLQKEDEANDAARSEALSRAYFLLLSNHRDYEDPYVVSLLSAARDPAESLRARTINSMTPAATVDREVSDDAGKLRSALKRGNHVLLVSHSQGNLYSNQAVSLLVMDVSSTDDSQYLKPDDLARLHVVGVAVPASYIVLPDSESGGESRMSGHYMTSDNDKIISGLSWYTKIRGAFQSNSPYQYPLPANMTIPPFQAPEGTPLGDRFLGHGFETAYTAPGTPWNREFIKLVQCALNTPRGQCPITGLSEQREPNSSPDPYFKGKGVDSLDDGLVELKNLADVSYPAAQIESVLGQYHDTSTQQAAREFSSKLWDFWRKSSGSKIYDEIIQSLELNVIDSEIKLLGTMRINLPKQPEDQLLANIQSTLTATPRVFADYLNADRLVSGHPVDIEVEKNDPFFEK